MKKYLILTSLLTLSACFGGGSGSSDSVPPSASSVSLFNGVIAPEAVSSNKNITQMTSGIAVPADGSGVSPQIRSGHVVSGGHTYNIYDLSDIEFKIAENPAHGNFKFFIENGTGRIKQIQETLGTGTNTINRIGDTQRFNGPMFELVKNGGDNAIYRIPDTGQTTVSSLFDALPAEIIDECSGEPGCHWNYIDEILDIGTSTRANPDADPDIVLTFSDFGKFNPVYRSKNTNLTDAMLTALHKEVVINEDTGEKITVQEYIRQYLSNPANTTTAALATWLNDNGAGVLVGSDQNYHTYAQQEYEFTNSKDFQLFAGGYAIKDGALVDTLTPTNGMHFSGKAIGRVYSSIQNSSGPARAALLSQYGLDVNQPIYSNVGGDQIFWYKGHTYADETTLNAALALDFNDPDDYPEALDANDVGHDMAAFYQTANNGATLDVDSETGDVTLVMPFTDFYTVTATQEAGANEATVTFTDKNENLPDSLARDSDAPVSTDTFYFGYYGIDTPTEAAGTVAVSEETPITAAEYDTTGTHEWEFQGAYGMTLGSTNN